jgi:hypothetical protein
VWAVTRSDSRGIGEGFMQLLGWLFIIGGMISFAYPGFGETYQLTGFGQIQKKIGGIIAVLIGLFILIGGQ